MCYNGHNATVACLASALAGKLDTKVYYVSIFGQFAVSESSLFGPLNWRLERSKRKPTDVSISNSVLFINVGKGNNIDISTTRPF